VASKMKDDLLMFFMGYSPIWFHPLEKQRLLPTNNTIFKYIMNKMYEDPVDLSLYYSVISQTPKIILIHRLVSLYD